MERNKNIEKKLADTTKVLMIIFRIFIFATVLGFMSKMHWIAWLLLMVPGIFWVLSVDNVMEIYKIFTEDKPHEPGHTDK